VSTSGTGATTRPDGSPPGWTVTSSTTGSRTPSPTPTWSCAPPARPSPCSTSTWSRLRCRPVGPPWTPQRAGRAASCCSTSRCRATSTPAAARCPTSPSSTSPTYARSPTAPARGATAPGAEQLAAALAEARTLVDDEADRFLAWTRASEVDPTIRALRQHAESVRSAELERLAGRLGSLDDRQRETVEALTRGIVNTLLHAPTVRLKELADRGGAELHAEALRELFELLDGDLA
jgi:hypothetical protein